MKTFGAIILALAFIVIMVVFLGDLAGVVIALLVLGTSVWVYFDAGSIGIKKSGEKAQTGKLSWDMGPGGWFISSLLIWIIAFPCYLTARDRLKQARRKCPLCFGIVPDGARKCMHCGGDLAIATVEQPIAAVAQPPRDSTIEEYERWKKNQGF